MIRLGSAPAGVPRGVLSGISQGVPSGNLPFEVFLCRISVQLIFLWIQELLMGVGSLHEFLKNVLSEFFSEILSSFICDIFRHFSWNFFHVSCPNS